MQIQGTFKNKATFKTDSRAREETKLLYYVRLESIQKTQSAKDLNPNKPQISTCYLGLSTNRLIGRWVGERVRSLGQLKLISALRALAPHSTGIMSRVRILQTSSFIANKELIDS